MAETQLGRYQGVQIVCQPMNMGTGPGVLLPLSLIKAQAPGASVLVTPADHHIPRPIPFFTAVRLAAVTASATPSGLVVLGAEAERPDADLGWILPRACSATSDAELGPFEGESGESGVTGEVADVGSRRKTELVGVFVEKPAISTARELFRRGGLWNTMVVLGRVRSFWRQAEQQLPYQVALFNRYVDALATAGGRPDAQADKLLGQLYRSMPRGDFSRSILQNSRGTGVVKLAGSGWCDCGTPERLLGCLGEAVGQGRKEAMRAALQSMLPVAN
jgi:mannose-1-phosphate guanylyltransferase